MVSLYLLHGINPRTVMKLQGQGIETTEALLAAGRTVQDRQQLAQHIMVDYQQLRSWLKTADLARIRTIGKEYIELLLRAEIESIEALAKIRPHQLHERLRKVNHQEGMVRSLPSVGLVAQWVINAKRLPSVTNSLDS